MEASSKEASSKEASSNQSAAASRQDLLSAYERRLLLRDIACVAIALGRDLSGAVGITPQADTLPQDASPLERLRLIEALWPRMTIALARLGETGATESRPMATPTPLPLARGGPGSARAVACGPLLAAAWAGRGTNALEDRVHPGSASLWEPRPNPQYDTRDNRFIVWMLDKLRRECGALGALAVFCGDDGEAEAARRIEAEVTRWRRRAPYCGLVGRPNSGEFTGAAGPTSAPACRALRAAWRTLNRTPGFDWSHSPLLRLPTTEPWHLYEIWCTLQVAAALRHNGWRATETSLLHVTPQGLRLTLATGVESRIRFVCTRPHRFQNDNDLTLIYRPYFRSAEQQATGQPVVDHENATNTYRSCSHVMQPDIALAWNRRLLLFDAKYKSYGPVPVHEVEAAASAREFDHTNPALLGDIDKMHAYRDAILCGSKPAVTGAWCLFPGTASSGSDVIAFPAGTVAHPFGTARIGAIRLRPGNDCTMLNLLVQRWLHERHSAI